MKPDFKNLRNQKVDDAARDKDLPGKRLVAVLKVNESGYVPRDVQVRSRIDAELFTAEFPASLLEAIRSDPKVASVELSRPLRQIG